MTINPNSMSAGTVGLTMVRLLMVALLATIAVGCAVLQPMQAREDHAFVGVDVASMREGAPLMRDQTVLVHDGRIAAIGPRERIRVPAGVVRIEGHGRTLLPGLHDMHVHLEHFREPDVLRLFLAHGVTTVRNMDGRPYLLDWRRQVEEGEIIGPRIVTAGPVLDGDPPLRDDNTIVPTPGAGRAEVAAQADAGYDFIKVYTNLDAPVWQAIVDAARSHGLPVAGHVPRNVPLTQAVAAGQTIEHLADFGEWLEAGESPWRDRWHWSKLFLAMPVDGARYDETAERLARAGVWTVPTLVERERAVADSGTVERWLAEPQMRFVSAGGIEYWKRQVERAAARMDEADWQLIERGAAQRARLVAALHAGGAPLLAGTDTPNAFLVPGHALIEELQAMVAAGIPPDAALATATREAARFLERLDQSGTIEPSKRADLLLVEGDPTSNIATLHRRVGVMAGGRWFDVDALEALVADINLR